MSGLNVPLSSGNAKADWERRVAQAVNALTNKTTFFQFVVHDQPDAAEQILFTQFPVPVSLVADQCSGWAGTASSASAVFTLNIGGSSAGTITFSAANQDAVVSLTTTTIPAFTDFEIVAPSPQDATLADITLTLAASL